LPEIPIPSQKPQEIRTKNAHNNLADDDLKKNSKAKMPIATLEIENTVSSPGVDEGSTFLWTTRNIEYKYSTIPTGPNITGSLPL
jgi:hypothetical protein